MGQPADPLGPTRRVNVEAGPVPGPASCDRDLPGPTGNLGRGVLHSAGPGLGRGPVNQSVPISIFNVWRRNNEWRAFLTKTLQISLRLLKKKNEKETH